jgi:ubiquitin
MSPSRSHKPELPTAAVALAVAALTVAGCGSGKTVDSSQVEKGIKNDLSSTAQVTSAKCPDNVKSETGATFTCDVKFSTGATGKVDVNQTGKSTFTYELKDGSVQVPGSVVEDQIKRSLAAQGAPSATVHCPSNIVVKVNTTVTCNVTGAKGATAGTVTYTFSSKDGTVDPSSVKTS